MSLQGTKAGWHGWRTSAYPLLAAFIIFLPLIIKQSGIDILYVFVVLPALLTMGMCVLIYAAVRRNLRLAFMLLTFWAGSGFFLVNSTRIRTSFRWLIFSRQYKRQVLAQGAPTNADLKHVDWDGWGFAGIGTSVYLVFDPNDSLPAAENKPPGKFGISECEGLVPIVHRLERHWYTVDCSY
jgi:hypothetical protein